MTSNEQERKMIERLNVILKNYHNYKSIRELSDYLNIPTSTIQRDLNKSKLIISTKGLKIYNDVQEWLMNSKKIGLSRGGKKSQEMYIYKRDNIGKYDGIKK